jgi:hypothetical protein
VDERNGTSAEHLLGEIDAAHAELGRAHERFLQLVAEVERAGVWADDGARDLPQWLWMRYGISDWKARRFIEAAMALPQLPAISGALAKGDLGIDKVIELTRFASFENEGSSRGPSTSRRPASGTRLRWHAGPPPTRRSRTTRRDR